MSPNDIQLHLKRQPFQTIRLTLTDGRTYEVRHPEMVLLGRTALILGLMGSTNDDLVYDRAVDISLLHIMQIEVLGTPVSPSAN